jgi:hypothetical protein
MGDDRSAFSGGEMRILVNDVEERLIDLPNVVEESDALDDLSLVGIELRGVGDDQRVGGNTSHVSAGLRVVRVDGIEERLEARRGHPLGALAVMSFSDEKRASDDTGSNG